MSERTMTQAEAEQEIIDILLMAYTPKVDPKPETTMEELGFDSLEVVEVHLTMEERFGEEPFVDFLPLPSTTVAEYARIARGA